MRRFNLEKTDRPPSHRGLLTLGMTSKPGTASRTQVDNARQSLPAVNPDRRLKFGLYDPSGELLYTKISSPSGNAEVASLSLPDAFSPLVIDKAELRRTNPTAVPLEQQWISAC